MKLSLSRRLAGIGVWSAMLALALVGIAQPAHAATITVPGSYATISLAIAAAADGDVIVVGDGTYVENVAVDKQVTLQAANPGLAVIQGTITLTAPSTVTGFTVAPSTVTAIGISITGAGAGSIVADNTVSGTRELIAVRNATATDTAPTLIQGNTLQGVAGSSPSAIWVSASSFVGIIDNTITNVSAPANSVGVNISQGASNVAIAGNTIDRFENAVAVIALSAPISTIGIVSNTISNTTYSAIVFGDANVAGATVAGNSLTNIAPGTTGRAAIQIGVPALPAPGGSPALDDFVIAANSITTGTNGVLLNDGVRLADDESFVVADNTFAGLTGNAIQVGTAVTGSIAAVDNDFGGAPVTGAVVVTTTPAAVVADPGTGPAAAPRLPDTGADVAPVVGASLITVLAGGLFVLAGRSRRRVQLRG